MRAVFINEYGDNGVVEIAAAARPEPLAEVRVAGVNPIDWKIRSGAGQRMGMTLLIRLGSEIIDTVEKRSEGVDGKKLSGQVSVAAIIARDGQKRGQYQLRKGPRGVFEAARWRRQA